MNIKFLAISGAVVAFVIVLGGLYISASNGEVRLRNQFNAQQKNLHNQLDAVTKKISQTAQVSKAEVEALKNIIVGNAEARAGQGGGSLATLVTEAVPNVDTKTMQNLQNIIAAARDGYARDQAYLLDIKREHDNVRGLFPSSLFVGGRPELEAKIVTSTRVQQAFEAGVDDNTAVFQ